MMATSSPWPSSTWRSTALKHALVVPPTNHLASGSSHSSTFDHGVNQRKPRATSAQKPSGSFMERSCMAAYVAMSGTWTVPMRAAKSAGGGKTRCSFSTDWIEAEGCMEAR